MKEAMDRLFYNGVIRTMDANVPQAQAVGIKDGKICFVGSNQQAEALATEERIDLQGQLMLPGFNEGHMHLATLSTATYGWTTAAAWRIVLRQCVNGWQSSQMLSGFTAVDGTSRNSGRMLPAASAIPPKKSWMAFAGKFP